MISQERVVVSPSFIRLGCAWNDFISSVDAGNWLTCEEGLTEVEWLSDGDGGNHAAHEPKSTTVANNVTRNSGIESALVRVVIILNAIVPHTVNNVL